MGMPPWAPNPETFLLFTQNAIGALDDRLRSFMEGAELYVADLPGPEVVVDGVDPRAATLVEARYVGPSEGDNGPLTIEPDKVEIRAFIYALNIMRAASGLHGVQQTIHEALELELSSALSELEHELGEMGDSDREAD
jgi:hypothetical protein